MVCFCFLGGCRWLSVLSIAFCLSNGCIFHFVGIYAPSGAAITLKIMLFNSSSAKKVCCTPRVTPHTRHSLTSININCLNCVNPVLIKPSLHTSPVLIRPHSCPVFILPTSMARLPSFSSCANRGATTRLAASENKP
jgi:hypothetical protein